MKFHLPDRHALCRQWPPARPKTTTTPNAMASSATLQTGTNLLEHNCCWQDVVDRSIEPDWNTAMCSRKSHHKSTQSFVKRPQSKSCLQALACIWRQASTGLAGGIVITANLVRSARVWHPWKLGMWRISFRNRLSAGIANMRHTNQTILPAWRCCGLPG
jgi:hypothetical protein